MSPPMRRTGQEIVNFFAVNDGRVHSCLANRPREEFIEVVEMMDAALETIDRPSFERRFHDLCVRHVRAEDPVERVRLEVVTTMLGYEYERLFHADSAPLRDAAAREHF